MEGELAEREPKQIPLFPTPTSQNRARWGPRFARDDSSAALLGRFGPGKIHESSGDAGAPGDGDGIEFFKQTEFNGVGVVGDKAFAVFVVERIIDVGL